MIVFTIPGAAIGKGRPKFARRGAFVAVYTPEKTASYESLVKVMASEAMRGRPPIDGAVSMDMVIDVIPPASWSAKKRASALRGEIRPTTKPDIDNMLKIVCDGMNAIVFADDKQICWVTVKKQYAETAQAVVEVAAL